MISAERMRVLMAGPDPDAQGGIATVVKNYVEGDLSKACDLRYITTMVEGGKPKKLRVACSSYLEFSKGLHSADVAHLHLSKGASYVRKRLLAQRAVSAAVPYIIHLHTGEFGILFDAADDRKKEEIRSLFSGAATVIALSEEWRDYLSANVCSAEKIEVVLNAVSVPSVSCAVGQHRDILFLGRLDSNKSPDALLRATRLIADRHPNAHILLAGDGNPNAFVSLANELGLAKRCEFLGWVSGEDKERLFERTAVYCLPSRAEGMPMALLEAMARGIPVVSTDVGGIPSAIRDGENGFLVEVGDDVSLADRLDRLLSDDSLRTGMGLRARKTIEEKYSIGPHVERLMSIYAGAMSAGRSSTPSYCRRQRV